MEDWKILGYKSETERKRAIKAHEKEYEKKKRLEKSVEGLLLLGYEEEAYQHYVLEDLPLFIRQTAK